MRLALPASLAGLAIASVVISAPSCGVSTQQTMNSAHPSRGCSQPNLVATGGNGLLYCFSR